MAMNMDAMLRIKADVQGENNIRRLGNSMQGLQGQVKNAALGFNNLKGAVAGFGAAIAGSAVVAGLTAVVKRSIDAGDELFNLQAKTGVAANALIGIGNAAKLADVDMATLGKGVTKLSVNLVKAAEGNDALARKFRQLGVDVRGADGQVVTADKALKQIADRFANMPDGAQKAAAAVSLFGKSGAELIPLLNEGAAAMEEFTYKVGDDFAARSDLFNDTITELGIKTQGFGLELTDALLPALQSILETFADLFDTKNDWNALFEVIKGGLRVVATVIFATIKLVDVLIKNAVAMVDVVRKAFAGDFAGAAAAYQNRVGDLLTQARSDFAQIQRIWTDAPSPGTGRRTGGRAMELDTSADDTRRASAARRAASEQQRIEERRQELQRKGVQMVVDFEDRLGSLNRSITSVGATGVQALQGKLNDALAKNKIETREMTLEVIQYMREVQKLGGEVAPETLAKFRDMVNQLGDAGGQLANAEFVEGFKGLLPSLQDYDRQIAEGNLLLQNRKQGIEDLSEVQKLQLELDMLGLEALAMQNPALAEHIELLKQRAAALDGVRAAQEASGVSVSNRVMELNKELQQLTNWENALVSASQVMETEISGAISTAVSGLATGSQSIQQTLSQMFSNIGQAFIKMAADIIAKQLVMITLQTILKALGLATGGLGSMGGGGGFGSWSGGSFGTEQLGQFSGGPLAAGIMPFAKGGIMTGRGPVPLKRYARGGIANKPQMALFGEGSMPEAYVPLPDGRRIPVAMQQPANSNRMRDLMGSSPAQGATAAVLNMSFETTNIGGVDYVSRDQLEAAMAETRRAAARDGAKRGMSMTLDKLQQSPSTRSRVGLR